MNRKHKLMAVAALATTASVALLVSGALAQGEVEEIIVTGSHIRGTPENAELPVDVLRRADLEDLGSPTIVEMIRNLGVSSGNIGETNQFQPGGQGNGGVATVNLRGLGSARTLALINGRRHVSTDFFGTDLSFIPTIAIGRVEVLKDGAAALYGSDAIGGVVNFISRSSFEGLEVSASHQFIADSDGDTELGAIFGTSSGSVNFMIAAEYKRRGELQVKDRDWALEPFALSPTGGWSTIGNPGSILPLHPTAFSALATFRADPQCQVLGGNILDETVANGSLKERCVFQYTYFDNLIEDENHYNVFTELSVDLDRGGQLYAELAYSKVDLPNWKTSPSYPPQSLLGADRIVLSNHPGLVALKADNPAWAAASFPTFGGAIPVTAQHAISWSRMHGVSGLNGEPQSANRETETTRFVAGMEGALWDDNVEFDVSLSWSKRVRTIGGHDMYVERMAYALKGLGGVDCDRATGVPGVADCEYYNPFSNAIQQSAVTGVINPQFMPALGNSPELINWLTGAWYAENDNQLLVFDSVFTGNTGWELAGGEAAYAVGVQIRQEEFNDIPPDLVNLDINPCPFNDPLSLVPSAAVPVPFTADLNCAAPTGLFAFLSGSNPTADDRTVWGGFGELSLPFAENFNVQLAIRYEDYGGETGSTVDPKIGVHWQISDALALRGSASTTFRGPALASLGGRGTALQFILPTVAFKAIDTLGNPDLSPESALAINLGVLLNAGNFSGSVDWWQFDFEDRIGVEDANQIVSAYEALDCMDTGAGAATADCLALRSHIFPLGTASSGIERIEVNWLNGTDLLSSGIDVQGQFDFDLDGESVSFFSGATLTVGAEGTYILKHEADEFLDINGVVLAAGGDFVGDLNDGVPFTPLPDIKANFFVTLDQGQHNVRYVARYVSSYNDRAAPSTRFAEVDSHLTHDLHYNYQWRDDTKVSLSIFNTLDEDPPLASTDLNYDAFTHNAFGRLFKVSITHQLR